MSDPGPVWELYAGDELLGTVGDELDDFPWLGGRFRPTPAFEHYRSVFEAELAAFERAEEESGGEDAEAWLDWDATYQAVEELDLRVRRVATDELHRGPLIHVDGEDAWFRLDDPQDGQDAPV